MGRPSQPFYRADRDAWVSRINGKHVTLAKGKRNKSQALKELYRILTGEHKKANAPVTVREVASYCTSWTKLNRAERTIEGYERYLGQFVKVHGDMDACLVTPRVVTEWLSTRTWGKSTRYNAITHLKRAFNLAAKHGVIAVNSLAGIENPAPPVRDEELDEATIKRWFEGIRSPRFLDLVTFIFETGCRSCEARKLEARHIAMNGHVAALKSKTTDETGKLRRIYLSAKAEDIVRRLSAKYPEGPIFRNKLGNPWTNYAVNCQMRRLRSRAGIGHEAVLRMLRKHWITDALERGVPIATVAELAGHQNTKMIENVYSKLSQRHDYLMQAVKAVRPQVDADATHRTIEAGQQQTR